MQYHAAMGMTVACGCYVERPPLPPIFGLHSMVHTLFSIAAFCSIDSGFNCTSLYWWKHTSTSSYGLSVVNPLVPNDNLVEPPWSKPCPPLRYGLDWIAKFDRFFNWPRPPWSLFIADYLSTTWGLTRFPSFATVATLTEPNYIGCSCQTARHWSNNYRLYLFRDKTGRFIGKVNPRWWCSKTVLCKSGQSFS